MKAKFFLFGLLCVLTASRLFCESAQSSPVPVSAKINIVPSPLDKFLIPTGNVEITFSSGQTEMLTKDGDSTLPAISPAGDIGWLHIDKSDVDMVRELPKGKSTVVVQMRDGEQKTFQANPEAPFIEKWGFTSHGSDISIESRGYHGHAYYVRYAFKTGKMLDEITEYKPFEDLPKWAQVISDKIP